MAERVTLARLDEKLEGFMQQVLIHMDQDAKLFEKISTALDGNGHPGLKTRIEVAEKELKAVKASKDQQTKAVWGTLVVVAGALLVKFIVG